MFLSLRVFTNQKKPKTWAKLLRFKASTKKAQVCMFVSSFKSNLSSSLSGSVCCQVCLQFQAEVLIYLSFSFTGEAHKDDFCCTWVGMYRSPCRWPFTANRCRRYQLHLPFERPVSALDGSVCLWLPNIWNGCLDGRVCCQRTVGSSRSVHLGWSRKDFSLRRSVAKSLYPQEATRLMQRKSQSVQSERGGSLPHKTWQ